MCMHLCVHYVIWGRSHESFVAGGRECKWTWNDQRRNMIYDCVTSCLRRNKFVDLFLLLLLLFVFIMMMMMKMMMVVWTMCDTKDCRWLYFFDSWSKYQKTMWPCRCVEQADFFLSFSSPLWFYKTSFFTHFFSNHTTSHIRTLLR